MYGPAAIAPVQYALQGGWAVLAIPAAAENADNEIAAGICQMMDQPQLMEELAKSAWDAGKRDHDQKQNALNPADRPARG